jgi:hypothetical protein
LAVKIDRLHRLHGLHGLGLIEGWKTQKPTLWDVVKWTLEKDGKVRPPLLTGSFTYDVQKDDRSGAWQVVPPQKKAIQPTMWTEIIAITPNHLHDLIRLG